MALGVAYVVFADHNGNFPTGLYLVIGILAFNYAVNSIMEKLDTILWKLEDIEQRLSPKYHSGMDEIDYAEPLPEPPPLPGSTESYQQQFRKPKAGEAEIDAYQRQFWKKNKP